MDVNEFWERARQGAQLNPIQEWIGPRVSGTVPPAAWAFGEDAETADRMAHEVAVGAKTTNTSLLWQYEAEGAQLPGKGDLSIILDGSEQPRALIMTTDVQVLPFDQVDEGLLPDEAPLAGWRQTHEDLARAADDGSHPFTPDMPVVLERFDVLYALRAD
ncbi:ASCH domain-containing protein [Tessaracoccus sp. Y36]